MAIDRRWLFRWPLEDYQRNMLLVKSDCQHCSEHGIRGSENVMRLRQVLAIGILTTMVLPMVPHARAEDMECPWTRMGETFDGGTRLLNACTGQEIVVYPPSGPVYKIDATKVIVAAAKARVTIVAIESKDDLHKITASAAVKAQMVRHLNNGADMIVATAIPVSYGGWTGTPSVTLGGHNEGMYLDVNQEPTAPNNFANKVTELGIALAGVGRDIANNSATNVGKAIGLALGALGLTIAAIGLTMKAIIASSPRGPSPDPDDPDPTAAPPAVDDSPTGTATPGAACCATDNSNGPGMDGLGSPAASDSGPSGGGGVSGGGGEGGSDGE